MLNRFSAWGWAAPALIGAVILALGWPLASDQDLFLHLKTGQLTAERGFPALTDPFGYTDTAAPEETHSWLSQWLLFQTFRLGGENALRTLNGLALAFLVLGCFGFVLERKSATAAGVTAALVILAQSQIHTFRPVIFGQLAGATLLFWILGPERPWTTKRGIAAALLTALWANLHGSAVLAPALVGLRTRSFPWTFACAGAVLLNPRGPGFLADSLVILEMGRTLGIGEWVSATYPPVLWIAGAGTLWALFRKGRGDWTTLAALLLCVMAFTAHRHLAWLFFPLSVAGAALAGTVPLQTKTALLGIAVILWGGRFWVSGRAAAPIERATDFLETAGIEGPCFNHPGWGAYLVYRLHPKIAVAHTMRLLTHSKIFLWEKERWIAKGGMTLDEVIEMWPKTRLAILPATWPIPFIADSSKWAPIYVNDQAAVLLRKIPENAENWKRAERYYGERKLPFDSERGFLPKLAQEARPGWLESQEETGGWGRWPDPDKLNHARKTSVETWTQWLTWEGGASVPNPRRFYWKAGEPPKE